MYLFDLNMSNMKSEALADKIPQKSLENNCVQESFLN